MNDEPIVVQISFETSYLRTGRDLQACVQNLDHCYVVAFESPDFVTVYEEATRLDYSVCEFLANSHNSTGHVKLKNGCIGAARIVHEAETSGLVFRLLIPIDCRREHTPQNVVNLS